MSISDLKVFLDNPGPRAIHKEPKLRVGGISIYFAILVGSFLLGFDSLFSVFMFISLTVFFVIGLLDDIYNFRSLIKFTLPFISSIVISFFYITNFTVTEDIFAILFISFWIFFNVNAFNLIDGIDGLCGSISFFTSIGFLLVSLLGDFHYIFDLSLISLSAILGFLFLNKSPAHIFLGDSGSHQIGLIFSLISLYIFKEINTGITFYEYFSLDLILLCSLVLMIGYPNFDAIFTTLTRISNNKLPWIGDRNHPHHKLLRLGYSNRKILLFLNLVNIIFIISGLILFTVPDYFFIVLVTNIFLIIYLVKFFQSISFEHLK